MSISNLGALIHAKPDEAKAKILKAIEDAKGDRKAAAEALATTHRSFYRYIERLRLWPEIDALMKLKKFEVTPGPPRSDKRLRDAVLAADGSLPRAARALGMRVDALRDRISELQLWDEINKVLKAADLPTIAKPAPTAS